MEEILQFAMRHGYLLLFLFVLAEQIGLPLPSIPLLLAGGALVATGHMEFLPAMAAVLAGSLLADLFWFELGRRRGRKVMGFLCRIAIEADSCVRRTEAVFRRYGARTLLVAKFVPGINTAAPPLAGMTGMPAGRFLLSTGAGGVVWALAFGGLGYLFADQLERAAEYAVAAGNVILSLAVLGGPVLYISWKWTQRRRFLRELRMARITPEELHRKLAAGEDILVIDLRYAADVAADPRSIPGALHMEPADLHVRHQEIPREREIALGCT
jgi:membrane protein DedA with SNARE-associated domain